MSENGRKTFQNRSKNIENWSKTYHLRGRAIFRKITLYVLVTSLDFASFDSFKEVTFFASILLVFHRKSWRSYLWIQQDHTYSFSTKLALFNDFVAKRRYFYEKLSIFSFWPKQMMFLNKNKGAISKIAPKTLLGRGRRYLNIINSVFLEPLYRNSSFRNEIAPLKTHVPKTQILQFAQKVEFVKK